MRLILAAGLLATLGGCATYDYADNGGGYYRGAPSVEYRYPDGYSDGYYAPYGAVPYGYGAGYYGYGYYGYGGPYYYRDYYGPPRHRPPPRPPPAGPTAAGHRRWRRPGQVAVARPGPAAPSGCRQRRPTPPVDAAASGQRPAACGDATSGRAPARQSGS